MRNFIGVDLGGTNIRAAIVSEDGTIKCMKKSESHPTRCRSCYGNYDFPD